MFVIRSEHSEMIVRSSALESIVWETPPAASKLLALTRPHGKPIRSVGPIDNKTAVLQKSPAEDHIEAESALSLATNRGAI
jgi:hypothetical protein